MNPWRLLIGDRIKMNGLMVVTLCLFLVLLPSANAEVTQLSVDPENPVKGDVVTVSGMANPSEKVKIDVSFDRELEVSEGKYTFSLDDVKIPEGEDREFVVIAENCENIEAEAKLWGIIPFELSSKAEEGVAKISGSVPSFLFGDFDIIVEGESKAPNVNLRVQMTGYMRSDGNGDFSHSYDTSPIPTGEFEVTANKITKTITLEPAQENEEEGWSFPFLW